LEIAQLSTQALTIWFNQDGAIWEDNRWHPAQTAVDLLDEFGSLRV